MKNKNQFKFISQKKKPSYVISTKSTIYRYSQKSECNDISSSIVIYKEISSSIYLLFHTKKIHSTKK